jgi:hypothetical protein
MNKKMKWLVAGTVVGLLAIAVAIPALAAGPNEVYGNAGANTVQTGYGNCGGLGFGPDQEVADLLGLTQEQIREQRLAGNSLVEIAATKNISEETLINTIITAKQEAITAQVTAGTMTQAQADLCLVQMQERVQLSVNRTTVGRPEWAGANGQGHNGSGMMRQGGLRYNQTNTGAGGNCTGVGRMMSAGKSGR